MRNDTETKRRSGLPPMSLKIVADAKEAPAPKPSARRYIGLACLCAAIIPQMTRSSIALSGLQGSTEHRQNALARQVTLLDISQAPTSSLNLKCCDCSDGALPVATSIVNMTGAPLGVPRFS